MSWPNGPRFRITELRGYAFPDKPGQRSSSKFQSSSFTIIDDAYQGTVRTFNEVPGRTRHKALGLALYVLAALNADPLTYVAGMSTDGLHRRAGQGYAPSWVSPRIRKERRAGTQSEGRV